MNCVFDIGYITSLFDVYKGDTIYKIEVLRYLIQTSVQKM